MKVLWLCNIVLPDFAGEYGIKRNVRGGWMTGMLHEVRKNNDIQIGLVFPIVNRERMRDGVCVGCDYFSFHADNGDSVQINEASIERFCEIIGQYEPDIVHIWGTEYPWCLEMVRACHRSGMEDRMLINIQGLVSVYAEHFFASVPDEYLDLSIDGNPTIRSSKAIMDKNGENEKQALKEAYHVFGRTEWDRACVRAINPDIDYHACGEILRDEFYEAHGEWSFEKCEKHRIFISQANYPIKGFHYLLRALPLILRKFPDAKVAVAGGINIEGSVSPYLRYISDTIRELRLEDVVLFLDRLDAAGMIEQYKKANVFVSPSSIENSSNSICEAMLTGTPVVASYVGGVPTFVEHGNNGLLYPETEIYMLADMIMRLFEDDSLCQSISENATTSMAEYVSKAKAIDSLLGAYKEIYTKRSSEIENE